MMTSIFTPSTNTCQCCKTEISTGTRCKRCAEQRDSQGVPFIIYCEIWYFQRRKGQQVSFWVYDNQVVNTGPQYKAFRYKHVSELQLFLEGQGYDLTEIVPPLGVIDQDFFKKMQADEN